VTLAEFTAVLSCLEIKLAKWMELIKINGKKGSSARVLLMSDSNGYSY